MTFTQFAYLTKLSLPGFEYFPLAMEWYDKRVNLIMLLREFPTLISQFRTRKIVPYKDRENAFVEDPLPRIRLSNSTELACNCLYSMAELSAYFSNKTTKGLIPSSFNALRKKIEANVLPAEIIDAIGDLQWYKKVREIRTELTHYSSIFIGEKETEPVMRIRSYRRYSDKEEFVSDVIIEYPQLLTWINNSLQTIDRLAEFLLKEYLLPNMPPDREITVPIQDNDGLLVQLPNGRFAVERINIREYLARGGLII